MTQNISFAAYAKEARADVEVVVTVDWDNEDVTVISAQEDGADVLESLSANDIYSIEQQGWDAFLEECAIINQEHADLAA